MGISENAKVWIYQANRLFSIDEEKAIQNILNDFTIEWQAHGHALAALGEIYYQQFIVLSVDEQITGASGCSIDKSVYLMKEIGNKFNLDLFDRLRIAYVSGEEIVNCSKEEFEKQIKNGLVTKQTLVFNNLISRRSQLKTSWNIPLAESWHSQLFTV